MDKKLMLIIVVVMICSGCGKEIENNTAMENVNAQTELDIQEVNAMPNTSHEKESYQFFIETNNYTLSLYEPPAGSYTGAYILSNKAVGFDIVQFESVTDSKHALYMYNMNMGDYFPTNWVLSCIANAKTPYIVLKPDPRFSLSDEKQIIKAAKAFGEFYIPMFVQLGTVSKNDDPEKYAAYFRKTKEIFRDYASNVAFVWSVDGSDVPNIMPYYPGDEWLDWVGIEIFDSLGQGDSYTADVLKEIDYFYYTFQQRKPILVSKLAVSHFSSKDHIYHTTPAALEVTRLYSSIAQEYPRIKGIIYMDFNGIEVSGDKKIKEDFSITTNDNILRAYKNAVGGSTYLTELDVASSGDTNNEVFKSPFAAYKIGNSFFVSEKCFVYDLNIRGAGGYTMSREIDGQIYYDSEIFAKKNLGTLRVDEKNKTATLQIK